MILVDLTLTLHDGKDVEIAVREYADDHASLRAAVERAFAVVLVRLDDVQIGGE